MVADDMADPICPTINVLSLCSGVGMLDEGLSAGLDFFGIRSRVLAYVEREAYAAATLLARMEEQSLEPAPIWCGDLERLDCVPFAGRVDCVVAGFPCQPWSVAGAKAGTDDARWLWPSIMGIVRAVGSPLVFLENVPGLVSGGGLDPVLGALAEAGFIAEWLSLAAADVGASHRRERIFILAVDQERGCGILRQSSRQDGQSDRSVGAMDDAAWISGGERAGRQRILDGGSGLGDANSGRRQGAALHARRNAQDGTDAVVVGGRSAELAHGFGEGRRPEANADQAGIDGMEEQDRTWRGERSGHAERRPELGGNRMADAEHDAGRAEHERQPRQRRTPVARDAAGLGHCSQDVAVTDGEGFQGGGQRHDATGRQEPHGYAGLGERELFAPGPGDLRWTDIIANRPDLAPAIEPGFRVLVDGVATKLDQSRADQLRCGGNGVVPLCAAAALVELVRRVMR